MQKLKYGEEGMKPLRTKSADPEGWYYDKNGYLVRSVSVTPGVYRVQLQHRKVLEDFLGRALLPHENVHHKNGVRDDNRIKNLELWSTSQPSGQRAKDKLAWARQIIALYEKDEDKL